MEQALSEDTAAALRAAVAGLGPGAPLAVVAASDGHAALLDNWLCHMAALGYDRILILAMDRPMAERLRGTAYRVVAVETDGSGGDFWLQRARVWALLAAEGIAFVNSDTDAVWLRDPVPAYAAAPGDVLFSQGTISPRDAVRAWGFVLCCGFFWVRPTPAARRLLEALVAPERIDPAYVDQAILNRMLVEAGTDWRTAGAGTTELAFRDVPFRCFDRPVEGACAALGLTLLLLPHALFPRLQPGAPEAFVRHVLKPQSPDHPIELLRAAGCWRLDAHPCGFAFPHGPSAQKA